MQSTDYRPKLLDDIITGRFLFNNLFPIIFSVRMVICTIRNKKRVCAKTKFAIACLNNGMYEIKSH